MTGMKLVASAEMDYRNSSIVGLAAALGVGVSQANAALATLPAWVTTIFGKSPVVLATIIAVCLNLILPKSRDEEKEEKIYDSQSQNPAVDNLGRGNNTNVLAVCCSWKSSEQGSKNIGNTISYNTTLKL